MDSLSPLTLLVSAYVLGSIPFSYLIVRALRGGDIRDQGSGNVGATNVLRTYGRLPAVAALILDIGKGWLVVLFGRYMLARPDWPFPIAPASGPLSSATFWIGLAGLVAVLAHMLPLWLSFRGGKGVAVAAGFFLAIDPLALAGAAILFLAVVVSTRYVSLASMLAAATVPILMRFVTGQPFWYQISSILIALAVIFRHRQNLFRLAIGEENRLGESRKK